jgi:hypothetical protein
LSSGLLNQSSYKALSSLGILFGLHPIVLELLSSVLFALVSVRFFLDFWGENGWSGKDFIEMLELLPGLVLIRIGHYLSVYLCHIRESVNNEGSQKNCVSNFIVFDRKRSQSLKGLQL